MKNSIQIYPRKEYSDLAKSDVSYDVETWEKKNETKLPVEYRNFLLNYFGGFPFPGCFDVSPDPWPEFLDENPQEITELYTWKHVQELISTNYYYDGYPRGYLIIGDAVSPVHLLLGIREDVFGKVFLWYHSSVNWGDEVNNERDLVFVADSFDDFIRSLYDDGSDVARRLWARGAEKAHVKLIEL